MSTPELSWGVCDEAMPTTISAISGLLVALAESTLETRQMPVNRPFSRQNDFAAEPGGGRQYDQPPVSELDRSWPAGLSLAAAYGR
jgi:hypothetical protein